MDLKNGRPQLLVRKRCSETDVGKVRAVTTNEPNKR